MLGTQLNSHSRFLDWILSVLLVAIILIGAAPIPRVVLFLGDSITAGYGLDITQAYPALIQEKIDAKNWPFKVVNAGQSGDTTAGGLNRISGLGRVRQRRPARRRTAQRRVDQLLVPMGAHDLLRHDFPHPIRGQ